jgi:TetR/AcrR family transcriptional regulator, fatty acid metabolism regulator protein
MTSHTATPTLKERQRQERERLILRAAGEVLADQGYDGMSMEDIASRVGISRAAIYLHFPSKEDLVFALLERGIQVFADGVDDIFASGLSPREKVRAIIEYSYGGMSQPSFRFFNAVLQSPAILSKLAERQRTMRNVWNPIQQRLTDVLDEGKRTGDFDPAMPTSLMVSLLSGLLTPFTFKRMVEQEGMPLPEVVNFLSRYFLKGIAPRQPDGPPAGTRPAY